MALSRLIIRFFWQLVITWFIVYIAYMALGLNTESRDLINNVTKISAFVFAAVVILQTCEARKTILLIIKKRENPNFTNYEVNRTERVKGNIEMIDLALDTLVWTGHVIVNKKINPYPSSTAEHDSTSTYNFMVKAYIRNDQKQKPEKEKQTRKKIEKNFSEKASEFFKLTAIIWFIVYLVLGMALRTLLGVAHNGQGPKFPFFTLTIIVAIIISVWVTSWRNKKMEQQQTEKEEKEKERISKRINETT